MEEESKIVGGETEAIKRMKDYLSDSKKVASFAKPNTDPTVILNKQALGKVIIYYH